MQKPPIFTIQQMSTKNQANIVPLTLKCLKQLDFEEIIRYQGQKVDLVQLFGYVQNISCSVSKKGFFQLIFNIQDISYGQELIQCSMTAYDNIDLTKNILERNQIKDLKQLQIVKCIIHPKISNKRIVYEMKHLEKVRNLDDITHHLASCIRYHCMATYNN